MVFPKISRIFLSLFFIIVFASQAMESMNLSYDDKSVQTVHKNTGLSNLESKRNSGTEIEVFAWEACKTAFVDFCKAAGKDFCEEVFGDFYRTKTFIDETFNYERMSAREIEDSIAAFKNGETKDSVILTIAKKNFDAGSHIASFFFCLVLLLYNESELYHDSSFSYVLGISACNFLGASACLVILFFLIGEAVKCFCKNERNNVIAKLIDQINSENGPLSVFSSGIVADFDCEYTLTKDLRTMSFIIAVIELVESLPRKIIGYMLSRAGSAVASKIGNAASSVVNSVENKIGCRPISTFASTIGNAASSVKNTVINVKNMFERASGIASVVCHRKQKPAAQKT